MSEDELSAMEADANECAERYATDPHGSTSIPETVSAHVRLLVAEVRRLRAALSPFAAHAKCYAPETRAEITSKGLREHTLSWEDSDKIDSCKYDEPTYPTVGDLRRAAAVFAQRAEAVASVT